MSSIQMPTPIVRVLLVLVVAILVVQVAQTEDGKRSSTPASKRLMKELKDFYESTSFKNGIFTVELVDDNIYEWNIKIFKPYPYSSYIGRFIDWKERTGKDHMLLRASYNDDYPSVPPFIKIVYPKLNGEGEGWICHELLTRSGWNSDYTIEPLILQLVAESLDRHVVVGKDNEEYKFDISERADYVNWMNEIHPEWFQ